MVVEGNIDKDTVREILRLSLEGYKNKDIAEKVNNDGNKIKRLKSRYLVSRAINEGQLTLDNIENAVDCIMRRKPVYKFSRVDTEAMYKDVDIDALRSEIESKCGKLELMYDLSIYDICYIYYNHNKLHCNEVIDTLGITYKQYKDIREALGLSKRQAGKPWKDEEVDYMIRVREEYSIDEIAEALGRTRPSVMSKLADLNILLKKEEYPEGYYRCTGCGELKPIESFGARNNVKRGHTTRCKECINKNKRQLKIKQLIDSSTNDGDMQSIIDREIEESANKIYKCSSCGEEKLGSEFHVNRKNSKNRRDHRCKACKKSLEACKKTHKK